MAVLAAGAYGYLRSPAPVLAPAPPTHLAVSADSAGKSAVPPPPVGEQTATAAPADPLVQETPPAPAKVAAVAPDVISGLGAALLAPPPEDDFGQGPGPDTAVVKTGVPLSGGAPDAVLPAPALEGGLDMGVAPAVGTDTTRAPKKQSAPLLLASSVPLTLAQVLLPGVAPEPNQISPSFDLVRVAPDGSAVIAGRAAPGANVQVFSGTIPVAEATASARGEFVAFLNAPRDTTLDLNIPTAPEGATLVVSQEDIIILPTAPDAPDTAPIVVRRTPDAVQIVQPAGPAIPNNISLDLVSYTASGAVQLAGRGQPGNVARIYTDGRLAGQAPIAQGGNWALEINDIAEGRYVLRVDEIAPDGSVLSRTESPFQRQFPAATVPDTFSQGAKIIVQPGNTLWLMATEAYGNGNAYSQIFSANKDSIRDPDLIYPGQIFSIPRVEK